LDQDSFEDATTEDGGGECDEPMDIDNAPPTLTTWQPDLTVLEPGGKLPGLPHWLDVQGWAKVENIETCLYPFYTGNTRELNAHPLNVNCWTDFEGEKHDYYIDGVLANGKNDPNKSTSATAAEHWLWNEFDAPGKTQMMARSRIKALCRSFLSPVEMPNGNPTAEVFWKLCVDKVGRDKVGAKVQEELFTSDLAKKAPEEVAKKISEAFKLDDSVSGKISPSCSSIVNHVAADLQKAWDENCNQGSERHESFDKTLQKISLSPTDRRPPLGFYRAFAKYLPEYDIFQSEFLLTDREKKLIGVADFILRHRKTGELFLCDFKNCKDEDLWKAGNPNGKGIHPFSANMADTKGNHYTFQLSFYRDILNRLYYPGMFNKKMLLLNFRPSAPDTFDDVWIDALDMAPFMELCPWKKDDPRHVMSGLIPGFPDSDPRAVGSVTRIRVPRDGDVLPSDVVWTGEAYDKGGPPLTDSIWKHPAGKCYGKPPKSRAIDYELHLRNNFDLLKLLPSLKGKRIACWCQEDPEWRCNADVIVKYANLYENGAFTIPEQPKKVDDQQQTTLDAFFGSNKRKRSPSDASNNKPAKRPRKLIVIEDDSF
jgi:hypothetical protein